MSLCSFYEEIGVACVVKGITRMRRCIFHAVGAFVICYITKFKSQACDAPPAEVRPLGCWLRERAFRQSSRAQTAHASSFSKELQPDSTLVNLMLQGNIPAGSLNNFMPHFHWSPADCSLTKCILLN